MAFIDEIRDGRTDKVFEYLAAGHPADSADSDGVTVVQWCAYYGDVSALKCLMAAGAELDSLGDDLGLNAASFHGHWRLAKFLIENGADVNRAIAGYGRDAFAFGAVHYKPCGAQPGNESIAFRRSKPERCDDTECRNRWIHARRAHQRRNTTTPRSGIRR